MSTSNTDRIERLIPLMKIAVEAQRKLWSAQRQIEDVLGDNDEPLAEELMISADCFACDEEMPSEDQIRDAIADNFASWDAQRD